MTNGLQKDFSFTFKFFQPSDIQVSFWAESGGSFILDEGTHYHLIYTNPEEGGFIELIESSAEDQSQGVPKYPGTPGPGTLLIERIMPLDQQANIRPVSGFPEEVITNTFDKLVMIDQQQQEQLDRCVKVAGVSDIKPDVLINQVERLHKDIDSIVKVADMSDSVRYVAENGEQVLEASQTTLEHLEGALAAEDNARVQANIAISQASDALLSSKNAKASEENALIYRTDSSSYAGESKVWAEGTDDEVQALGGVHSSKKWAELAADKPVVWGNLIGNIQDQADLQGALDNKQDKLTVGENIIIENNVISAKSGGMPIGYQYSLECTDNYIPEGSLTRNGAEYSKRQFTDFWDNYLTNSNVEWVVHSNLIISGDYSLNKGVLTNNGLLTDVFMPLNNENIEAVYELRTSEDVTSLQFITPKEQSIPIAIKDGVLGRFNKTSNIVMEDYSYTIQPNSVFNIIIRYDSTRGGHIYTYGIGDDRYTGTLFHSVYEPSIMLGDEHFKGSINLSNSYLVDENNAKEYIATERMNSALPTCSYTQYRQELDTYGFCNKFAVDTTNETFKVPTANKVERYLIKKKDATESDVSWYNIYSDGWCEQGGDIPHSGSSTTVYYTIPFKDLSYTFTAVNYAPSSNDTGGVATSSQFSNKTVSSIYISQTGDKSCSYHAEGYIDISAYETPHHFVVVANESINQSQMDWNEWASSLNGKANADLSNCTKPYIVEVSDKSLLPSWYRVWSNGWCEQGGYIAAKTTEFSYLFPFVSTEYSLIVNFAESSGTANAVIKNVAPFKTNSGFTIGSSDHLRVWEAKGYIE